MGAKQMRIANLRIACGIACVVTMITTMSAQAATSWVMVSGYPDNNYVTENIREFIKEVDEKSNGELKISLHSNGSLVKMDNIRRAVQTGQVQMGEIRLGSYGNEDPMYILDNVPYMTKDYKQAWVLMETSAPYFDALMAKSGIKPLGYQPFPGQGFFTQAEIHSAVDLHGKKLRIYSKVTQEMGQKLGATAIILPFADIPQAFATGMIDGLFTSAQTGVDIQAWTNSSHFTYVGAIFTKTLLGVNKEAYDALPENLRTIVDEAGHSLTERAWRKSEEANQGHIAELEKNGMKTYAPPADVLARLTSVGQELAETWKAEASPEAVAVLDAYRARIKQ